VSGAPLHRLSLSPAWRTVAGRRADHLLPRARVLMAGRTAELSLRALSHRNGCARERAAIDGTADRSTELPGTADLRVGVRVLYGSWRNLSDQQLHRPACQKRIRRLARARAPALFAATLVGG